MPNYDYECKNCGEKFSRTKLITAKTAKSKCPKCKKLCSPQIGTPGFKVKGGTPKFHRR